MVIARYLVGMLAMLCAFSLASTAQAQQAGGRKRDCLPIPLLWLGTLDDVANISTLPVPQSYRKLYFGDSCTRSRFVAASLIDWHLAFGNEASTTAALAFLEADATEGKPVIADLGLRLASARLKAQHDIAAAILRQPGGPGHEKASLRKRKRLDRLETMIGVWNRYTYLANQYLRAAQFYDSPSLFARARSFATPALDALRTARALAAKDIAAKLGAASPLTDEDYEGDIYGNLEMRMAIASAGFSRDPKDLAAAEAVLAFYYVPFYRVAAREAFRHGDNFCDTDKRPDLATYAKACASGQFKAKAITWWRYRAQLDLLGTGSIFLPQSADTAIKLIERDDDANTGLPGVRRYGGTTDQIVALHLASADALVRRAGVEQGGSEDRDREDAIRFLSAALNQVSLAERLAPASQTPGRFRQIATRFLAIRSRLAALEDVHRYPALERQAAYFSTVLAGLDDIAQGRSSKQ